ncbi:MAG: ROK family transcriptional regulator [Ruminococcaceae bacterium]|nr:ROK family transcriptional regulator [Oscillospiraceae bacterium]
MSETTLKNIKYENTKAIFSEITLSKSITRAEISEKTGLSLVTVGKIAESLIDTGIISQVLEAKPHAGRRAGSLSVNENMYMVMVDVCPDKFIVTLYNLRMELIYIKRYDFQADIPFSENVDNIMGKILEYLLQNYDIANCLAIGVSVVGSYMKSKDIAVNSHFPEISSINLHAKFSEYFPSTDIIVSSATNVAALYNATIIPGHKEKGILYWYISYEIMLGAFILNGNILAGRDEKVSDFGATLCFDGLTLEDKIKISKSPEACAEEIALALYNTIKMMNPHAVILEIESILPTEDFIALIKNLLTNKYRLKGSEIPEIIGSLRGGNSAHLGLAMEIRHNWLENLLYSK